MSGDEQVEWVFRVAFMLWFTVIFTAISIDIIKQIVSAPERKKNRHFARLQDVIEKDQGEFGI